MDGEFLWCIGGLVKALEKVLIVYNWPAEVSLSEILFFPLKKEKKLTVA